MKHLFPILISIIIASASGTWVSAQDYPPVPVTISKEKVKMNGKTYLSHIVQERQTLYSIAKAYGVTVEQLYEANPSLIDGGLRKNAIILIPVLQKDDLKDERKNIQEENRKTVEAEDEGKYIIHTVRWYEDLDVIAGKYNVTVQSIMSANGLTGRKLTRRQKLRIPLYDTVSEQTMPADTIPAQNAGTDADSATLSADNGKGSVTATMMLPFDAMKAVPNEGSMDFYCGALMAVKQIGDEGSYVDLNVYDVDGNILPSMDDQIRNSDVIIGPISPANLEALLAGCPKTASVVSPLDHRAEYLCSGNPNFIQAPASSLKLYEDLARWIREDSNPAERVIAIYEKGTKNTDDLGEMSSILESAGVRFMPFSYSILEGRDVQKPLMELMTPEAANRVIVLSESEAFVNDVVRNLNLLIHDEFQIVLYGSSKIRGFETIEVDNLHNTCLHTSSAYYVDYDDVKVKDFVKRYRALYNTEPTPFAFQGYDITYYFLKQCSEGGKDWLNSLEENDMSMLQSNFRFRRASDSEGFVNTGVRRIVYGPDYSVSLEEEQAY